MKWLALLLGRVLMGARRFPVAALWCGALFLFLSWGELIGQVPEQHAVAAAGTVAAALAACLAILAERLRRYGWLPLLSLPIGAAFYVLNRGLPQDYIGLHTGGLVLAAVSMGIFFLWDRAHGPYLFAHVFAGAAKAVGVTLVVGLSLTLCLAAVRSLLFVISYEWFSVGWYLAVLLVGVPLFLAWLPSADEPAALPFSLRTLSLRILLHVYLVLVVILLGYIGKMIAVGTLPVGEMNWYASLAVLGYGFLYFILGQEDNLWLRRFFRWGVAALIPIVATQILCVEIRVTAYGLTPLRYASILCSLFGLVLIITGALHRPVRWLYPLAAAFLLLASVTPANLIDLPMRDQQYRVQQVLEANDMIRDGQIVEGKPLSVEDREKVASAYHYFHWSAAAKTNGFAHQIANSDVLRREADRAGEKRFIQVLHKGPIPVAGWSTLQPFHGSVTDGVLSLMVDQKTEFIPMQSFWTDFYDTHKNGDNDQEALTTYDIPDGRRILFQNINFQNGEQNGKLPEFHVEGYILKN